MSVRGALQTGADRGRTDRRLGRHRARWPCPARSYDWPARASPSRPSSGLLPRSRWAADPGNQQSRQAAAQRPVTGCPVSAWAVWIRGRRRRCSQPAWSRPKPSCTRRPPGPHPQGRRRGRSAWAPASTANPRRPGPTVAAGHLGDQRGRALGRCGRGAAPRMTKAELTAPPHMPRTIPGSGPHQAIRLMPRLMQPVREVLPFVQRLGTGGN
jgi:hypothetical protein